MIRDTPDPTFSEAARAELVRRVAAERRRPARRFRVELVASVAVVTIAAAVVVGVQRLQPAPPVGGSASTSATSAPPSSAPPSTTSPSEPLVGPTGARMRSAAELRAFAADQGFSAVWAEQGVLDTACMAEHGFVYDPILDATSRVPVGDRGMSAAQEQAYADAEDGPDTGGAYDWRTAGCHGRSVHLTGQDDAH